MFLSGAQILAARDRKTVTVPCPEWGGDVLIGSMGALDRARITDWFEGMPEPVQAEKEDGGDKLDTVITCDSPGGKPEPLDDGPDGHPEQTEQGRPERKYSKTQHTELMLRCVAASILNPETYEPAFSLDQIEDLGRKDPKVLNRIYDAALALNLDTKESAEQAEKNSGPPPDGSGGV